MLCPQCQYENPDDALVCSMCSHVLKKQPSHKMESELFNRSGQDLFNAISFGSDQAQAEEHPALFNTTPRKPYDTASDNLAQEPNEPEALKNWQKPVFEAKSAKHHLSVGFVLALIFSIPFFIFKGIGWFFSSLVHEMGHTLTSYYLGSIALPALRLDGHAATYHMNQSIILSFVVWLALIAASVYFKLDKKKPLFITCLVLAISYPILSFTPIRELMFLAGGHLGEMVIATIFLWRAMVPAKAREEERSLYAALGFYLWMHNLHLNASLALSEKSRQWYLEHGSFGLENDWVRFSDHLGWSLGGFSFIVLLCFIVLPPLGLYWARISVYKKGIQPLSSWDD